MRNLWLMPYLIVFSIFSVGCCGDDGIIDQWVTLKFYNLDKSDNLFDSDGPYDINELEVRSNITGLELVVTRDSIEGIIYLNPFDAEFESGKTFTNTFALSLNNNAVLLNINYEYEESKCYGIIGILKSYEVGGDRIEIDNNVSNYQVELLVDF